jgi:hypothetical protein
MSRLEEEAVLADVVWPPLALLTRPQVHTFMELCLSL